MNKSLKKKWSTFAGKGCPECGQPLIYGGMTQFFEFVTIAQDTSAPGDIQTGKDRSDAWSLGCMDSSHDEAITNAFNATFKDKEQSEVIDWLEENKE